MEQGIQYANWWSKLLFKKKFEKQFFIPIPSHPIEEKILKLIEQKKFNLTFDEIKIDRPIFIVGLPRSGTTMLYNLLCAHEKAAYITNSINACPESICTIEWLRKKLNLNITGERFLQDSIVTDFGSPSEPILHWGKWFNRDIDSKYWNEKRINDLPEGKPAEIYLDIKKIISTFGESNKRFICKYPVMQTELRIVQDLFPDAHFIHIVRDARPAANSLKKLYQLTNNQIKKIDHPWVKHLIPYPRVKSLQSRIDEFGEDSIQTTAHIWQDAIKLVHETAPALTHFLEVKYEDILVNPSGLMNKIFSFCGLDYPTSLNTKYQIEFANIGKISHTNKYSDFDKIEAITQETLAKLNYPLSKS